jgi:hypothetical protein
MAPGRIRLRPGIIAWPDCKIGNGHPRCHNSGKNSVVGQQIARLHPTGEFGHLYRPLVLQEVSSEQPALVAREGPVVELLRV